MLSKWKKFEKLSEVNSEGIGNKISTEYLDSVGLGFGNGADWARKGSSIWKKYKLDIIKNKRRKIISIQIIGFNNSEILDKSIGKHIYDYFKNHRCVATGTSSMIEIDHKNGFNDDFRLNDIKNQKPEYFQPLCKSMNDIKRQHCKICRKTNIRFDAKSIGYNKSFYKGNEFHSKSGCDGCYWYDIKKFRKEL